MERKTADHWEQEAKECLERNNRRDSEQLDPSDCALSRWADNLSVSLYRTRAEIERNGGKAEFNALFNWMAAVGKS